MFDWSRRETGRKMKKGRIRVVTRREEGKISIKKSHDTTGCARERTEKENHLAN